MSLGRKVSVGVLWNLASILMGRGASVLFTLFLARLLAPDAFGLIAMISVVFELANVLAQSGLGQAIIRSKLVSTEDLSTAFIANLGLSLAAYGALYLAAPWLANFYDQPQLTSLVRVAGLVVFLNALKLVQAAVLHRAMNFRAETVANTVGAVASGTIAVTLAYLGFGVWSLVAQILVSAAVSAGLLWAQSGWRPTTAFSLQSFRALFGFGSRLALESLVDVLFRNSYILVIGRLFSVELTGLYFFAKRLNDLVSQQLTGAVQQATFPALATLQDDDELLRVRYRQVLQVTVFMIAPAMLLLAALAEPLFKVFFAPEWGDAVPYLQWLCLVGLMYPLHALNINILKVKGRSDLVLYIGLAKRALNIALLIAAIPFGVEGIVISQVIGSVIALAPNTFYANKLIAYGLGAQLLDAAKPVGSAAVAAFATWLLLQATGMSLLGLVVGALLGTALYLGCAVAVRAEGWGIAMGQLRGFKR